MLSTAPKLASGLIPSSVADYYHSLPRNQVPEWSSAYINYKGLKKLIKGAVEVTKTGQDADLTGDMACSIHVIVNS
jgi:glycerophosphodiester phosphodiesterase